MVELKESTLAEEEVVRLVEMKCAKLRQEIFCFKRVSLIFENHREELEGRMVGMEEGKDKGGDTEDWKEVRGDRIMEKRWKYIFPPQR